MFDHIDCLGEVALRKAGDGVTEADAVDDEDYDSWGIEIRVAFRKNEALQALDNHRQSGGERAVSTILYLQALQTLVAAPFRVVDEINQGMDERNERLVHSLIVDSACQQGSSQYFLITPKLLPDLDYHPLMKVLCIFNGEWQPESFNFGKYITNARNRGR
ncbi:Structural maintenance of chromosomes protein 5 [Coemansia sp. S610]|nr:Structural maintenance of chromosomes protein 5 [Coemansia sp. S610]